MSTVSLPCITRAEAIKRIKTGLQKRSGKTWSVTGGRGTAWGWLRIDATPARCTWHHVPTGEKNEYGHDVFTEVNDPAKPFGHASPEERAELATLLGIEKIHFQGEQVPSGSDFYWQYIDMAEGNKPRVYGSRNWD